jgi:hypothetical protein
VDPGVDVTTLAAQRQTPLLLGRRGQKPLVAPSQPVARMLNVRDEFV